MQAVILAAGGGKRLKPVTDRVAKPMLPVGGRPIIGQIIEAVAGCGIREFIVVVGHLGHQIREYLGNGGKWGVAIEYVEQEEPLGSAHALKKAERNIGGRIMVSAADALFAPSHYRDLLAEFRKGRDGVISLKRLPPEEMIHSSTVALGEGNRILKVIEKPARDEILSELAAGPVYVFRDVKPYLRDLKVSPRGEYEIPDLIQAMIDDGLDVRGVEAGTWAHLTTVEDLRRFNSGFSLSRFL
jgi:NDP-sugar pyrophosphorylase family protein